MTGHPGYLLPAGECFTEEMACALVFYPDKPEYRRALYGSLVYLSTWLAWERDPDKRGKDAARAWKDAVDLTMDCMNMACLEELINDVETIRILMENKKDCCDDGLSYFPTEDPKTDIAPDVGDPPEFYGETEISDWEEWKEHVCFNANKYVDYLIETAEQLQEAVSISSIFIGFIGAALGLLGFAGILLPVPFAIAAAVVASIVLLATNFTFQDTAEDFEDARTSIVCAILNGWQLSETVEAALSSGSDWDLFYQFVDYDAALAIIFEGGYNEDYLPADTDDSCICDVFRHFEFTFDEDVEIWSNFLINTYWDAGGYIKQTPSGYPEMRWDWTAEWHDLETHFDLDLPIEYNQLRFRFYNSGGTGSPIRHEIQFKVEYDGGADYTIIWDTDDYSDEEWHAVVFNFPETRTSKTGGHCFRQGLSRFTTNFDDQRIWFDDIGLYLR